MRRRAGLALPHSPIYARGRKRGISPVIATQRLAKLAASVVSELHNFLLGLNIFDRDVARASDLLGFGSDKASTLRDLRPGEFYALGPALCSRPLLVKVAPTVTHHVGATPDLVASADVSPEQARSLLDLDNLREVPSSAGPSLGNHRGVRTLDTFLLDHHAPAAARIVTALRGISPNATTAAELAQHLGLDSDAVHGGLDVLSSVGAIDTMPRGDSRIARLSARLRLRASEATVVGLA